MPWRTPEDAQNDAAARATGESRAKTEDEIRQASNRDKQTKDEDPR